MGENRRKKSWAVKVRRVRGGICLMHVVEKENLRTNPSVILPASGEKKIVPRIIYRYPHPTTVLEKVKTHSQTSNLVNMTIDDLLSASHALSICQNGRKLDLKSYSPSVRNYVKRVIEAGTVDSSLKKLNQQIVLRIGAEVSW